MTDGCAAFLFLVIPTQAGIQPPTVDWMPAFTGVTIEKWAGYLTPKPYADLANSAFKSGWLTFMDGVRGNSSTHMNLTGT